MTDVIDRDADAVSAGGRLGEARLRELVEQARAEGVQLTGEGGLRGKLTKLVVESALEGEMDDHLGYARHDPAGRGSGNSRNGRRAKTVVTEAGPVEIEPIDAQERAKAAGRRGTQDLGLFLLRAVVGVVFIGLKGVEYTLEYREHLLPGLGFAYPVAQAHAAHLFFSFYLVATGLHAVHVAIGIVVLVVVGWRARHRAYSGDYHSPVTVAGLYWHFVDLVWVFLFALIYLPGRSG